MRKKKIMIIDDDKEFLEEFRETLNLSGYDTWALSDGQSALGVVFIAEPDVILLDLKMKGKSGFQIASELKSFPETAHIPIIAMTAFYTEKEHAELMNRCGIQACLIKPFNPQEAVAKIKAALKKKGNSHDMRPM